MKELFLLLFCTLIFSCQSEPESAFVDSVPVQAGPVFATAEAEELPAPSAAAAEEEVFDPQHVPQELFTVTLEEVQQLITSLNSIIRSRRYDDWLKNLSQEYIDTYSSPEYLRQLSEEPRLKAQNIVLTSLRDYFIYNVVPSRANINKVDDIEFISPIRVKAFTENARGQRLRLYELEKDGKDWKIIS
jgi:hypothetical protein